MDANLPVIAGGEPAKTTPFTMANRYGDEELQELKEALDQGTLFYAAGKKVAAMEAAVADMIGTEYAVATSSGTASIHTALTAAGISPGDEVITTSITDMGTIVPILYQGAIPVYADLDPRTANLDPASVAAKITDKTRAIIAVHLAGNACDLEALMALAKQHDLVLIEDCAQAWGCTWRGKPVGSYGDIGCFSFNEFKHIACGDGGAVVCNDADMAQRLRWSTDKGYNRDPKVNMRDPHFLANNYRMTELQGAVALAQTRKLDSIIQRRRAWCQALTEGIGGFDGLQLPRPAKDCEMSYWFYMMRVDPGVLGADATTFAEALGKEGLPVGAHYIQHPVYDYPLFQNHSLFERGSHACDEMGYTLGDCPVTEAILDTCVILSVKETYSQDDLQETIAAFNKVGKWFNSQK